MRQYNLVDLFQRLCKFNSNIFELEQFIIDLNKNKPDSNLAKTKGYLKSIGRLLRN